MEHLRGNRVDSFREKQELLAAMANEKVLFPLNIMGMGMDFTTQELVSSAVSKEVGVIASLASAIAGHNDVREELYETKSFKRRVDLAHNADSKSVLEKIAYVRERNPNAIMGMNLMHAVSNYGSLLQDIGKSEQVDILYVGAGIPKDLPKAMVDFPNMQYVPIVSSARVAKMLTKLAKRPGSRAPLAFYVELPTKAGGHLGAKDAEDAQDEKKYDPQKLFDEIQEMFKEQDIRIPLILGGGMTHYSHIKEAHDMGYAGVGMGTRFLLTQESGMPDHLIEESYLNPNAKIVTGETSPAGLPSRYIENLHFDQAIVEQVRREVAARCDDCIHAKRCGFINGKTDFCITEYLSAARRGEQRGLMFAGVGKDWMWRDDLYNKNGELYVPSVREAADYTLDPANEPQYF